MMYDGLPKMFARMDANRKVSILARVTHDQTIFARAAYGTPEERSVLQKSNELVHKLAGHSARILAGETSEADDASFLAMILEALAEQAANNDRVRQYVRSDEIYSDRLRDGQ